MIFGRRQQWKLSTCIFLVFLFIWESLMPIAVFGYSRLEAIEELAASTAVLGLKTKKEKPRNKKEAANLEAAMKTNEILVKYKKTANKVAINTKAKTKVLKTFAEKNAQLVKVNQGQKLSQALETYTNDPHVEFAEPNYAFKASYVPNDPSFLAQWPLAKTLVPQAWDIQKGSANITIAIVDTGVDLDHEDLSTAIIAGYDFVDLDNFPDDANGHGTHVAGIAAGALNNGKGIAGLAGGVKIMPVRVLGADGFGYLDDVAEGITWAADNGAKVINLSLGIPVYSYWLEEAVNYAHGKGAVVVAATGNEASEVSYPAAFTNVIAVGATMANGKIANFSNFGPEVDVVAPGVNLLSTLPNTAVYGLPLNYGVMSGTSMASPMVTGLAALLLSQNPALSPAQVREKLLNSADDLGQSGFDDYYGYGQINAFKALNINGATNLGDQFEANNDMSSAVLRESNLPLAGTFFPANDQDWFKYNLDNGKYKLSLSAPKNCDLKIEIFDKDGLQIKEINTAGIGEPEIALFDVQSAGTYFFKITELSGNPGSGAYTFEVDPVDAFELNDEFAKAMTVNLNQEYSATINPIGDNDFYKVQIPQDGVVTVDLQVPLDLDGVIEIYDSNHNLAAKMDWGMQGEKESLSKQLKAGEYYIKVYDFFNNSSLQPYALQVKHSVGFLDNYELNDNLANAPLVNLNEDIRAKINPLGDLDYYKFVISETRKVQLSLKSPPAMDGMLTLFDAAGQKISEIDDYGPGLEEKSERQLVAGTYFVLIEDYEFQSHQSEYTFRINVDIVPPTVISTVPVRDALNVSVNGPISLTFSENIAAGSNYNGISLKDNQGNSLTVTKSIDKNLLKIEAQNGLDYVKGYTVILPAGAVKDLEGNSLAGEYSFSFTTEQDLLPFNIQSSNPTQNGKNFFVDQNLVINFSKNIVTNQNYTQITLRTSNGDEVPINKRIEANKLILDPVSALNYKTDYRLTIPALAVKSVTGQELVEDWSVDFRTGGVVQSNLIKLPFRVNDAVVDPDSPIIYLVSKQEKKLYKVNYESGDIQSVTFASVPESIDIGKGIYAGEIYVTLVHGEHSYYWWKEAQSGAVAIVDKELFNIKETFTIQVDPWDIEAGRDGYLYIPSGSGQHTNFDSYSRATKARVGRSSIDQQSYAKMHPTWNRIYTINTQVSPRDLKAYNISNGSFVGSYDSRYHGDYALNKNFVIDPTGQYIFNGSGNIFKLNASQSSDMVYHGKLNLSFTDIAFEKDLSKIYVIPQGIKYIYTYDGQSYAPLAILSLLGKGLNIFNKEGEMLALIEAESPTRNYLTGIQIIPKGQETVPPTITTVSPESDSLEVPVGKTISVDFNEMVLEGANYNSISVKNSNGQAVASSRSIKGSTLIIKPTQPLAYNQAYTIDIPQGSIKDLQGNLLEQAFVSTFKTEKALIFSDLVTLPYEITDAVLDPDNPFIYLLSKNNKKLIRVNYLSGVKQELSLPYTSTSMDLGKGIYSKELYLGLSNLNEGEIAVVNRDSFTITSSFSILTQPLDLAATRDGYIMVARGSGVDSYHRGTGQLMNRYQSYYTSDIKLHPFLDRLYGVTKGVSPSDTIAYNFANGNITGYYDSVYHGDYPLNPYYEIDPTGLFLFNGSGTIYSLSAAGRSDDLQYVTKLDTGFSSMVFDSSSKQFYTLSLDGKTLNVYDNQDYLKVNSLSMRDPGKFILTRNGDMIAVVQPVNPTANFKAGIQLISKNKPSLNLNSPGNDWSTNQVNVPVEGVTEVGNTVTVNGESVQVDQKGRFSKIIKLTEGNNQITVIARNQLGETTSLSRTVILDTIAPVLNLNLTEGNLYTNTPILRVSGETEINTTVIINNNSIVTDELGLFSYDLDLKSEGTFELTVSARDKVGNLTVAKRTIVVDSKAPSMKAVNVPTFSKTNSFRIQWVAEETGAGSGLKSYDLMIREKGFSVYQESKYDLSQNYFDFTGVSGKAYYFAVRAKDKAGNTSAWLESSEVLVDTAAPHILLLGAPSYSRSNQFSLSLKAEDLNNGSGIQSFDIEYRQEGSIVWNKVAYNYTEALKEFSGEEGKIYYFRVRARDKAGNVSAWTDGYERTLIDNTPPEAVIINPAKTNQSTFTVIWSASDPGKDGVTSTGSEIVSYDVKYRVEGSLTWLNWLSDVNITGGNFTGSPGKTYYFRVFAKDVAGNQGPIKYSAGTTIVETVPPEITQITVPMVSTSISKNTTFKVSWSAKDAAPSSGIASYDLQYRKGGTSSWEAWKSNYKSTTASFNGSAGSTYYFRIRARDNHGNLSNWTTGTHTTIVPYDNDSLISSRQGFASLSSNVDSSHYLGSLRSSAKSNDSITYKVMGNKILLLGYKGTLGSKAKIYIDGVYRQTIDTYSTTPKYRQVLYEASWSKVGTHTIKIVNLGTTGRNRVYLDGIGVGR